MAESQRTPAQEWWLRFFNTVGYNALAPVYNSLDWLTLGAWWRLVRRALDYCRQVGASWKLPLGRAGCMPNWPAGLTSAWEWTWPGVCAATRISGCNGPA